ncbi:MAG: acyl-CoA thioesterase [Bacteroidetes bacterium]|nr:acyl-CoA thioesterase [Bacteroidota bacterium]
MYRSLISTRVRYAETDQMGVVYYGNYSQYFEIGRVESLRALNLSYKKMEEEGIMLPVLKLEVKYLAPATYDDLIEISSEIRETPSTRITFHHEIRNEAGKLLTIGMVQLVFVDKLKNKPTTAPQYFLDKLKPYFDQKA